ALALEEVAEGDGVSGLAVVERVHGHGVPQDPRRGEILARTYEARLLPAFVDLDPARSGEADDPDLPGAGGEQLGDLGRELLIILSRVGVFHRQRGRSLHPAGRVGYVADGHVWGAQRVGRGGV